MKQIESDRKARLASDQTFLQRNNNTGFDSEVIATAQPPNGASNVEGNVKEARAPSSATANFSTQQEDELPQEDSWRAQEDDHFEVKHLDERTVRDVIARTKGGQEESNKENMEHPHSQASVPPLGGQKSRFIDPQPDALRITFESQASQTDRVSVEEDFQTQQPRTVDVAARRRAKPKLKRPRALPIRHQDASPEVSWSQETARDRRSEVMTGRLHDESLPSPELDEHRVANTAAKERKNFKKKPVQRRTPWSDEETHQLISLIEKHGVSWTLLMQRDERTRALLQDRGQVGLRDKARNVKMDYLRYVRIEKTVAIHKTEIEVQSRTNAAPQFRLDSYQ